MKKLYPLTMRKRRRREQTEDSGREVWTTTPSQSKKVQLSKNKIWLTVSAD